MSTTILGPRGFPLWAKDPSDKDDYGFDWTLWLAGRTIVTSVWIVPADLTKEDEGLTTVVTLITLSGGAVPGRLYLVTNRITGAGFSKDQSFEILIREQ